MEEGREAMKKIYVTLFYWIGFSFGYFYYDFQHSERLALATALLLGGAVWVGLLSNLICEKDGAK
jgi:hypothetical protein